MSPNFVCILPVAMETGAERGYLNQHQALRYDTDFIELYSCKYCRPSPVVLNAGLLSGPSSSARSFFATSKSTYFLNCALVRFAFVSSLVFPMPPFAASRMVAIMSGLLRLPTKLPSTMYDKKSILYNNTS